MRMRKKKNLEERLEKVSDVLVVSNLEDLNFATATEQKEYIDLEALFGRPAPLFLEIGCGKGKFALEYAALHPEINLLAVEKSANVIVEACEKTQKAGLSNLKFLKGGAEYLEKYLRPGSVCRIFLNFSCPFQKESYDIHRLTHARFLKIYRTLLSPGAEIHQKTDNMRLFEFSLEQLSQAGFTLKNVSLDLHNSGFEGNIETEYEHRFVSLGQPIYRLEAYLPEDRK